jgi:Acetyltransferase (GNAT) domain
MKEVRIATLTTSPHPTSTQHRSPTLPFPLEFPKTFIQLGEHSFTIRVANPSDAATWATTWQDQLRTNHRDDGEWHWQEHIERAETEPDALCLCVDGPNGIEALLSLRLFPNSSRLQAGCDTVYIEYVGVAPWNQAPPIGETRVKGLGRALIRIALALSMELGKEGRVGLHAKPDVEGFYQRLGFSEVGYEDEEDGKWLYFESTPEFASVFVKGRQA